ncbi:dockerin type I repeat-containing protein [Ruminococcus sp.]
MKKSKIIAAAMAASMLVSSLGVISASAEEATVKYATLNGNNVLTYLTNCTGEEFVRKIDAVNGGTNEDGYNLLYDFLMWSMESTFNEENVDMPDSMFADGVTYGNVYLPNDNLYNGTYLERNSTGDLTVKIPMYYNGKLLTMVEFVHMGAIDLNHKDRWMVNNVTDKATTEVLETVLEKTDDFAYGFYSSGDYYSSMAIYVDGEVIDAKNQGAVLPTIDQVANDSDEEEVSTLVGDVNLDGSIDLTDAVMLGKIISGSVEMNDQQKINADCTKDGSVTTDDTQLLMQFLMRKVETL